MNKAITFLLTATSMVALSTVSRAADMSPPAMPTKAPLYAPASIVNWTGGYVGVQGGVVRRDSSFNGVEQGEGATLTVNVEDTKTGGTAGALAGYNWQQGSFVYGLEGDWNWTGTKADHDPFSFIGSYDVNWLATIRGRVGVAYNSALFYATGGAAFGHVKNTVPITTFGDGSLAAAFIQDQTKVGWTLGGGFEYMFTPHWTARAEFRYVDLGKTSVGCTLVGGTAAAGNCSSVDHGEFKNTLELGLVGLAYKF